VTPRSDPAGLPTVCSETQTTACAKTPQVLKQALVSDSRGAANAWQQRRMLAEPEPWMQTELAKHAHEVATTRRRAALLDVARAAALDGQLRGLPTGSPGGSPVSSAPAERTASAARSRWASR
jgi:hypothetical protein